jgi:hypothetical protein
MYTKLNVNNPKVEGQLRELGAGESKVLKRILETLFQAPSQNAVSKHQITAAIH